MAEGEALAQKLTVEVQLEVYHNVFYDLCPMDIQLLQMGAKLNSCVMYTENVCGSTQKLPF